MSKYLKTMSQKAGLSPGALMYVGDKPLEDVIISAVNFDNEKLVKLEETTLDQCIEFIKDRSITWINISGIHDDKLIEELGSRLHLHPLVMEDIMNTTLRTKLDDYHSILFLILRMLTSPHTNTLRIKDEQVSILLGSNFVISFIENKKEYFNVILKRLEVSNSRIRRLGADYLFYCLIDCIIDYYFIILENIDNQLDHLERKVFEKPSPNIMKEIQLKKREISTLRKAIWPLRDVISALLHTESALIKEETKTYFRDVYDHTIQMIDTVETFRELASSLLDVYMSSISQKINEVMKVLTVVSTIFVPLTFIASVYGMNFKSMGMLDWEYGHDFAFMLMALIGLIMLIYFRKRKWI